MPRQLIGLALPSHRTCVSVLLRKCACVCAALCLCGAVFVQRCVCVALVFVQRYVCAALCLCGAVFVWRCVCAALCLCGAVFVWRCVCAALVRYPLKQGSGVCAVPSLLKWCFWWGRLTALRANVSPFP